MQEVNRQGVHADILHAAVQRRAGTGQALVGPCGKRQGAIGHHGYADIHPVPRCGPHHNAAQQQQCPGRAHHHAVVASKGLARHHTYIIIERARRCHLKRPYQCEGQQGCAIHEEPTCAVHPPFEQMINGVPDDSTEEHIAQKPVGPNARHGHTFPYSCQR